MSATEVFVARFGMTEAARHVTRVADEVGIERAVAGVILDKESDAQNVWGRDPVPTGDTYEKHGPVTRENYLAYKAWRDQDVLNRMQGCGPTQLTWYTLQDRADKLGGCWKPGPNMQVGFGHFLDMVADENGDLHDAAGRYNGGTEWRTNGLGGVGYAEDFMQELAAWRDRLGEWNTQPSKQPKKEAPVGEATEPSRKLTYWLDNRDARNAVITYIAMHESVGMTEALSLAKFCGRAGVSYHAIVDNDKIVFCVPRSWDAWHLRSGNPNADGLCLTTPLEGYSRAEWLGSQRNKVRYAAWWAAVCAEDRELDCIVCNEQNVRDAIWDDDLQAGGLGTHALYTVSTDDGTHLDPRNFPVDVWADWVAEYAGYRNWGDPLAQPAPKPQPEWPKKYTVQEGDTLSSIAREFNTSWQVLAAANEISEPYTIFPGEVLLIPKPEPEVPKVPPPEEKPADPWAEHGISGLIKDYYDSLPQELRNFLGDPVHPIYTCPDGVGTFVSFDRYANTPSWAAIYSHPDHGTYEVYGSIKALWSQLGFETGELGYPLSGELSATDDMSFDRYSLFEGGWIGWQQGREPEAAIAHYYDK